MKRKKNFLRPGNIKRIAVAVRRRRGPKHLDDTAITAAAVMYCEKVGADKFSIRGLANVLSIDPSTICYHFGNKDALKRAVVQRVFEEIQTINSQGSWQMQLVELAVRYRKMAITYPNCFSLIKESSCHFLLAKWLDVFSATGFDENKIAILANMTYRLLIGFCLSEAPRCSSERSEGRKGLKANDYPDEALALPCPEIVFRTAVSTLIAGVEASFARRNA